MSSHRQRQRLNRRGRPKRVVSQTEYEVERILDMRIECNQVEYYLKWKDFSDDECTWEPLENIKASELITEYEIATADNPEGVTRVPQ